MIGASRLRRLGAGGQHDTTAAAEPATLEYAAAELTASLGSDSLLLVAQSTQLLAGWLRVQAPFDEAALRDLRVSPSECPGIWAAFGAPGDGVAGFRRSHGQALHARRVSTLRGARSGSVTAYRDVALAARASADPEHMRDFVRSELGGLLRNDDHTRRLSATLRVYLEENASPRRTASRLGVHEENTIANRIRTAQEILDRPIDDRVAELLVALRLAPLVQQTTASGS